MGFIRKLCLWNPLFIVCAARLFTHYFHSVRSPFLGGRQNSTHDKANNITTAMNVPRTFSWIHIKFNINTKRKKNCLLAKSQEDNFKKDDLLLHTLHSTLIFVPIELNQDNLILEIRMFRHYQCSCICDVCEFIFMLFIQFQLMQCCYWANRANTQKALILQYTNRHML